MSFLSCIEIEPTKLATAAVIWLHGLGASGHDFSGLVPELGLPPSMAVRFILPHAPQIPVTINDGAVMPAWYDILAMTAERQIDEQQLLASAAAVTALIEREIERGIDSRRIILAGFSQGGAVAYQAALGYGRPLAGLMALSTYIGRAELIECHEANRSLPIQLFQGNRDPVVLESMARQALAHLQQWGYKPGYESYPMQHEVCLEEIKDISSWLQARLLDD